MVVCRIGQGRREHPETRAQRCMRHTFRLIGDAHPRLIVVVGSRHQRVVHAAVARENHAERSIWKPRALLSWTKRRTAAAVSCWWQVRVPSQAEGQGEVGFGFPLVLSIKANLPSAHAGDFSCALRILTDVAEQKVGKTVACVVAVEGNDGVAGVITVLLRKLMPGVAAEGKRVITDRFRQPIRQSPGLAHFTGRLRPARTKTVRGRKPFYKTTLF